jgi:hypothetical protein
MPGCQPWEPEICFDLAQPPAIISGGRRGEEAAMDCFIRRENIKHYRELLKTVKDEAECQQVLKLLAEEQQKQKDAGDKVEE